MLNMKRRIEKLESKTQSIKKDADGRQVKLLEIERLEGQDSLRGSIASVGIDTQAYVQPC